MKLEEHSVPGATEKLLSASAIGGAFRRARFIAGLPILLAGVVACGDAGSPVHTMLFSFEPDLRLPVVYSELSEDGKGLTLTTNMQMGSMKHDLSGAFEELAPGASYHAWADSGDGWTHLGEFLPGTDFAADVESPGEVQVTIESSKPPASPSAAVVVAGEAGGTLTFSDLVATSFTSAHVEATIDGTALDLVFHELPSLPAGYRYELWSVPTDEDGGEAGTPVSLGQLDPLAEEFAVEGIAWPEMYLLALSIEAESGAEERSELVAFVAEHENDADAGTHSH